MQGALKVQEDLKNLVEGQGEQLNYVEGNIDDAKFNVNDAHENLNEGR